ncbi:Ribonucleases P/MRP protein subunit pop1 [Coemansia sp. RSA 637]|nr:Ribonucleases P/MRP protein subunit pop1 [Coemansia sp. RSA 637]
MALWMALNFAGARAQGLTERHHIGFEAGLPTFPANWPGTSAYDEWAGSAATALYQKWQRRPPGKRVNYLKFGINSPFYAPFHKLLDLSGVPEAYPQVTADGLECHMKRLRKITSKKKEGCLSDQMDIDEDADLNSTVASRSSGSTADMWLLTGELLATAAASLLASTRTAAHEDPALPTAFLAWAAPLLEAVRSPNYNSNSDTTKDIALLQHCLVRVRLVCVGRGVPAENAPICTSLAKQTGDAIGFVMTSSFSLARGCGIAVGACSLYGLYQAWLSAAESKHAKSLGLTVQSLDGSPSISTSFVVLP